MVFVGDFLRDDIELDPIVALAKPVDSIAIELFIFDPYDIGGGQRIL
jgi:hypothetical protein